MRCDSARHGERLYNFSSSASAFGSVTGASRCGNVYGPLNTRKDTKIFNATSAVRTAKSAFSKIKVDALTVSGQEALVFQPRVMAEVHEQTQLAIRCAEIIQDLRTVLVSQLRDRFDFKKYFFVANEIRTECLNQCTAAILQRLRWLRQKWNSLEFQLDLEALMINLLEKPAALILVNGKARPEDRVAFIFVNQFCFFFFSRHWCVSWAKTGGFKTAAPCSTARAEHPALSDRSQALCR